MGSGFGGTNYGSGGDGRYESFNSKNYGNSGNTGNYGGGGSNYSGGGSMGGTAFGDYGTHQSTLNKYKGNNKSITQNKPTVDITGMGSSKEVP